MSHNNSQYNNLMSSLVSTSLIILLGFYPGGGLITSGKCEIPSRSWQLTLSVSTEKTYGKKIVKSSHLEISSLKMIKEYSLHLSDLSANVLSNYLLNLSIIC